MREQDGAFSVFMFLNGKYVFGTAYKSKAGATRRGNKWVKEGK
jgi:hypothetical protein